VTLGPWLSAAGIGAVLPPLMAASSAQVRSGRWRPESARKFLHVALGTTALSFPWTIGAPGPVVSLSVLVMLWLLAVRRDGRLRSRFGDAVHAVERPSLGEFHFTSAIALAYLAAHGRPLHYCLPLAILVFADTAAALVGASPGARRHPLGGAGKTWEGSLAFFLTAAVAALVALSVASVPLPLPVVALALLIALDATLLELFGPRGSDNLLIPLGVLALLAALECSVVATVLLHLLGTAAAMAVRARQLRMTPQS
jgi:phytol kinase